jgi:hypothetical protein
MSVTRFPTRGFQGVCLYGAQDVGGVGYSQHSRP